MALSEHFDCMQWIAASFALLIPRNDIACAVIARVSYPIYLVIARAESPWRSTVSREADGLVRTRRLHAVDFRVGHLRSLLAMTSCVC
jgi:hypothetical protein